MPDTETRPEKLTFHPLAPRVESSPAPLSIDEELPPLVPCANCAAALTGPYCAQCGQHVADYHRSVWRFVADFFDNTFCWDNKLFRTLGPLFRQPGFLTLEFMQGRRMRYVHPLRLFLFTSAVCLTLLQFGHMQFMHLDSDPDAAPKSKGHFKFKAGRGERTLDPPASPEASLAAPVIPAASATPATAREKDDDDEDATGDHDVASEAIRSALAGKTTAKGEKALPDDFGERITRSVEQRIARGGGAKRLNQTISEGIQNRLSWVALILLPVFAFLLRAVYWRADTYYFAHLVFSLHYHTFLLLFWTGYAALQLVTAHLPFHSLLDTLLAFSMLLPPIYLYKALRSYYGESRKRAAVKSVVVGSIHLLTIFIGISAVGAAAFFSATK